MIEIVVVIVLLGVLTAITLPPMIGSWTSAKLRTSARDVYLSANYARAFAITRQTACRLELESDAGRFALLHQPDPLLEPDRFEPVSTDLQRPMQLREGVRFAAVQVEPRITSERAAEGAHSVTFYPTGEADAARIEVADEYHGWTLRIAGSTGRVELIEGRPTDMLLDRVDLDR